MVADLLVNIFIIGLSFLGLNWASNLGINNALKVSKVTGLSKTAIGFSLIAFSTSLPELTVAVIASLSGGAPLSVGNILGSNIVNIALIIGLAALIIHYRRPRQANINNEHNGNELIPVFAKEELGNLHFGLLVASIIPLVLIYIAQATWALGFALISIFVVYIYQISKVRIPQENGTVSPDERKKLKRYLFFTFLGAMGVIISAKFIVESAVAIAGFVGVPQTVIGSTIVAFGTSLPEITMDLKAFMRGQPSLAFGDIIGSSFINITLILGITLFLPALVDGSLTMNMSVYENLVIFSIITNIFFWYFLSQGKIGQKEGAIFLFLYVLFLITTVGAI